MTPEELSALIASCVDQALDAAGITAVARPDVKIERPRSKEHGDYATSVALQLANPVGRQPREIAELIASQVRTRPGIASVDVAGPGFLNIRLAADALGALAGLIVDQGWSYGTGDSLAGQYINLEFVSANPTGPLHIGHVRWAAVGDALGRLLEAAGARVVREYYVNDAGVQIDRFALSLDAALRGQPTPEDGYGGAYIQEIAAAVGERYPDLAEREIAQRLDILRADGMALMFDEIKRTLSEFGVHFDVYFSEASLHRSGAVERAVQRLRAHGNVYEQDGAVWLRTTEFGDDKDRVLVKSDGSTTYLTADLAYYLDKRDRGFDRAIYMLGADHHGYIGRMRAMVRCYGEDPDQTLEILIGQLVNLFRDGAPVRMSKRAGTGLTLAELVEAVGVDAARYSLARSSTDTTLDLDLDVLTRASNDNPVYYVQYAHARIANLLRQAAETGHLRGPLDPTLLSAPQEAELLAALGEFPRIVATAAAERAPHRIARYLETSVAPSYHRFYDACRVLPPAGEELSALGSARLWLCEATRIVLANGLALLGVSAPERL